MYALMIIVMILNCPLLLVRLGKENDSKENVWAIMESYFFLGILYFKYVSNKVNMIKLNFQSKLHKSCLFESGKIKDEGSNG